MTDLKQGLKVVSLLPSATELVCTAGGEKYLVGRSHECDYPRSITDRAILTAAINKFESCKQVRKLLNQDQSAFLPSQGSLLILLNPPSPFKLLCLDVLAIQPERATCHDVGLI